MYTFALFDPQILLSLVFLWTREMLLLAGSLGCQLAASSRVAVFDPDTTDLPWLTRFSKWRMVMLFQLD